MAHESSAARAYLETPLPPADAPWQEVDYSVVDLELTGLDPEDHEIISFGAVTVTGGRVRLDDARHLTIRPARMPSPDTIRIHGLREQDLSAAPSLDQVLDEILAALTGRALVAHAASIETGFLRAALSRYGIGLRNPVVDTAGLALELRRLRREAAPRRGGDPAGAVISSPGLSELARFLNLPVHRPHHADGDALTTAQAFIALAAHLDAFQPQTLRSLERASAPPRPRPSLRSLLGRFGLERFRG